MRKWARYGVALLMAGGCQMSPTGTVRFGAWCGLPGEVRAAAAQPEDGPPPPVVIPAAARAEKVPARARIVSADREPVAPVEEPRDVPAPAAPPPPDTLPAVSSPPGADAAGIAGQTVGLAGQALAVPPPPRWPEEAAPRAKPQAAAGAGADVRLVNSKRISLNYAVQNVGSSGVTAVELWCTRDGRGWKKLAAYPRAHPPCVIDVEDEDLYGFTIVVRNGVGLGKTPQEGDRPQVWVEVDTTRPFVRLMGVEPGPAGQGRSLTVLWKATDKNLGPRPVRLGYAARPEGPWLPIAADLENTGRYVWHLPAEAPHHLYLRVEAVDRAGNVGMAQTPGPLLDDLSQPTAAILGVEGKEK